MVSIIVPVYNTEAYLDKCINSIVEQTYKDIEIILVDDCSTDNSLNICKKWNEKDDRIRVFSLEKNSGPSAARNRGLKVAKGEYIIFVDADDYMEKNCIKETVKIAICEDADLVFWNLVHQFGDRFVPECIIEDDRRVFVGDEISFLCKLFLSMRSDTGSYVLGLMAPTCKLFRATVLSNVLFPEDITSGEDACFNMQVLSKSQKAVYINKPYYYRRYLEESLSNKVDIDYAHRALLCTNWMIEFCKKEKIVSEEEINSYAYTELKAVITHYMKSTFPYGVAKKQIDFFVDNLEMSIKWNEITEDSKMKRFFLERRLYWIYRVYFKCKG